MPGWTLRCRFAPPEPGSYIEINPPGGQKIKTPAAGGQR